MLAYVFWHWPLPTISAQDYTDYLSAFHQSLNNHAFPGFYSSHVFQTINAPWGPPTQPIYEDWYLVEDFASLGMLNAMAITGANKAPHDQAAHYAYGGTAGLYQLCIGELNPTQAHVACWFTKPTDMPYALLLSLLRPLVTEHGGMIWQRQMTLGPTPEFCWQAPVTPPLPDTVDKRVLPLYHL